MSLDIRADEIKDEMQQAYSALLGSEIEGMSCSEATRLAALLYALQAKIASGARVTYRSTEKLDGDAISKAWSKGLGVKPITLAFGCSRSTAYKFHPSRKVAQKGSQKNGR